MSEEKAKILRAPSLFQEDGPQAKLVGIARLAGQSELADTGHLTEYRALQVRSILNHSTSKRGLPFGALTSASIDAAVRSAEAAAEKSTARGTSGRGARSR